MSVSFSDSRCCVLSSSAYFLKIGNDLKWNDHVDNITAKASRQVYLLKGLVIKYRGGGVGYENFFFKYWFSVAHPRVI